ncbi:MAG: roadblock/LC7 domain-containing protein [Stenotrophomonas sp.]
MEQVVERAARTILRQLQGSEPSIQALAWVDRAGQVITALFQTGNQDRVGAMSASLLALSAAASREVALGPLHQVILNGTEGTMLLTGTGKDHVLLIAADNKVNLGRLLLHAQSVGGRLAGLAATPVVPVLA